ncbi:hypothetical protein LWI28_027279 [Acer negundo]|uniref:Pectinesterase inhibitor domain-containing protein n=1 Tax=Acer negundo TaxID=4023 RepID=A0AAD5NWU6_ACENE|nr:hypothetical protein LWI28_027279 [Acer negundo]
MYQKPSEYHHHHHHGHQISELSSSPPPQPPSATIIIIIKKKKKNPRSGEEEREREKDEGRGGGRRRRHCHGGRRRQRRRPVRRKKTTTEGEGKTLNSAPGAATANLTTLADYSFRSTYAMVATTDGFLNALKETVTDPSVKQVVTHCVTNYDGSIPFLQSAISGLAAGASDHYEDVNAELYKAWANIHDCDTVVKTGPPPPGLPDMSTKATQLVDISETGKGSRFTTQTLTSAPGAATADLTTLAAFSLKSTYEAVAATDAFLMALQPNVTDPSVKQSLLIF